MEDPTRDSYALKMYSQRKASIEITPSEPQFVGQYVGKIEVFVASGKGCTQKAVQKIWDDCYDEKGMKRVSLLINYAGITMKELDGSKGKQVVFDIKQIAYCCAEQGIHNRVFAWISKDPGSTKLECHAVLCSVKERAQLMSLTMHQAFHVAYKDWKKAKEKRAKARTSSSSSSQNGINGLRQTSFVSSQDSGSVSEDSEGDSSDGMNSLMETLMAQMNIIEEEEMSMMDNAIVINAK